MSQVTIYAPGVPVEVFNSDPPVDQTELVANLNALIAEQNGQIIILTAERDTAQNNVITLQNKIDAAKAALM